MFLAIRWVFNLEKHLKSRIFQHQQMFQLFDLLKKRMDFKAIISKIRVIEGDVAKENLGISNEDRRLIVENVNFIYHCAATIRFDEPLKTAVELNTRGTKLMVELALQCEKLDVIDLFVLIWNLK